MVEIIQAEEHLSHYGILRRSGRYPWGSGNNPHQRSTSLLAEIDKMRAEGLSDTEIARGLGMTTTQLRAAKSIAKNQKRAGDISQAQRYKERGWSNTAIAERLGVSEGTVRNLLAPGAAVKSDALTSTAEMLKQQVEEKGFIDVGTGVDRQLNVSNTHLNTAIAMLEEEGYTTYPIKIDQLSTGHQTTVKTLVPPGVDFKEAVNNPDKIKQINAYSEDDGATYKGIGPPKSIDSKRVSINYAEDGGADADGVMYIRPGVEDLSLGKSNYAQVRIAVDDSHYLKGMAIYKDDLPAGTDILFNTNKSKSDVGSKLDALKPFEDDPDNPFGSTIRRQNESNTMNIINEEGAWGGWSKTLSSQFLSKQSPRLAKEQLDMMFERKQNELDVINSLTNPVVKKKLLEAFADDADASAAHLKAAALPRQSSHVLMPIPSMKSDEVYAPNFRDGERVALVRHPHGGTFEIPELVVNNRQPSAKSLLGRARDAIGINAKVAERLSGADFDGDAVLVIPNDSGKVKSTAALKELQNFNPRTTYQAYDGMRRMSPRTKQIQMGEVSNLITDMTIKGASQAELARAVKHSMVVIDAEKHNLNYRQSAKDNGITQLKKKYQKSSQGGASTLISRAGSEADVSQRKPRPASEGGPIDKRTGKKKWVYTGEVYENSKGELVKVSARGKFKKLAEVSDARKLSSGTVIEEIYASHSNKLKDTANRARREMVNTKNTPYSPSAKKTYAKEVDTLNAKLDLAIRNRPRERQAQVIAGSEVSMRKKENPEMGADELKKAKSQALARARTKTGAQAQRIEISPVEWDAVQAGAISSSKLRDILDNSDLESVKKLATPRETKKMTSLKTLRAQSMANAGYTQAEIADQLGVSVTTLQEALYD